MSMMPRIFGEQWFDDFFDFPTVKEVNKMNSPMRRMSQLMKTDVREDEQSFELDIDLPGFKKEDIQIVAENGYLTVAASQKEENQEEKNGKFIRRERYTGSCSRSFFIGDKVLENEIAARFEDGILKLSIPKMVKTPEEARKYITIQ